MSSSRLAPKSRPRNEQTRGRQCSLVWLMSLPPAEGETEQLDKDKGMVVQPGMGRNPQGIQPVWWPETLQPGDHLMGGGRGSEGRGQDRPGH